MQLLVKIAKNAKWQVDRPLCLSMLRSLVGLRAKDITCAPSLPLCCLHKLPGC